MKTSYELLPRWKKMLVAIRMLCPYVDFEPIEIEFDDKKLGFRNHQDRLYVVENKGTHCEDIIIFSEDGQPDYLSDWAKEPATIEPYDMVLYEKRIRYDEEDACE